MSNDLFDRFFNIITWRPGDPTYSILKTHLLLEDALRTFLERAAENPEALKSAKLSFSQVLQLVRAFSSEIPLDAWIWKALVDLNKLRNMLAHNLDPIELKSKIDLYVTYVVSSAGVPLPPITEGTHLVTSSRVNTEVPEQNWRDNARYYEVDMANGGLYTAVMVMLRLIPPDEEGVSVAMPDL